MNNTRSRWAAIGAAIAITLGAGGVGIGHATSDSGDGPVSAFFPIEPCRLAANQVILADSSVTLDGWGTTGDCELPDDISGLAANVTAVNATQQTNLRFYAQGDDVPGTANLNPTPGAAPTPNAVNISLNETNGQFSVYNRFGNVGVFIDIMGYYDNHTHDDRYYTKEEVDAAIATPETGSAYAANTVDSVDLDPGAPETVLELPIEVPAAGTVTVSGVVNMVVGAGIGIDCWINLDATAKNYFKGVQTLGGTNIHDWADVVEFEVTSAGGHTINLVCEQGNGTAGDQATLQIRRLAATYHANTIAAP